MRLRQHKRGRLKLVFSRPLRTVPLRDVEHAVLWKDLPVGYLHRLVYRCIFDTMILGQVPVATPSAIGCAKMQIKNMNHYANYAINNQFCVKLSTIKIIGGGEMSLYQWITKEYNTLEISKRLECKRYLRSIRMPQLPKRNFHLTK